MVDGFYDYKITRESLHCCVAQKLFPLGREAAPQEKQLLTCIKMIGHWLVKGNWPLVGHW